MPIEKSATAHEGTAETPFDLPNICFMGSAVVSGIGSGIVVLTGPRTAFGIVATAMAETRQLTSFDKGITHFTWLMLGFILVMAPLVFVINGVTKGNWLEALLFAVAVAVGLTPEMLPMIVTVNLAKGAIAMSRKKVIVKRLNAIQNFGAMDVLCTDKTGTLTQDLIILKRHLDIRGGESTSVLEYAYLNSFYQSGLKNLLDVAVRPIPSHDDDIARGPRSPASLRSPLSRAAAVAIPIFPVPVGRSREIVSRAHQDRRRRGANPAGPAADGWRRRLGVGR